MVDERPPVVLYGRGLFAQYFLGQAAILTASLKTKPAKPRPPAKIKI